MKNILLSILCFSLPSFGMQTQYLTFEEPPGWRCELSSGVYICQSSQEAERTESLILVFAAPMSEWDSLSNYENYLNQSKVVLDENDKPINSKVTFVRRRNVNGVDWIDSLQQNSELVGFWTRYVATVQKPLAILVTYVVSNQKYADLTPSFERMVASLKPVTDFKFVQNRSDLVMPGTELGGILKGQIQKRLQKKPAIQSEPLEKGSNANSVLIIIITVLVAGAVLTLRRRKKPKT